MTKFFLMITLILATAFGITHAVSKQYDADTREAVMAVMGKEGAEVTKISVYEKHTAVVTYRSNTGATCERHLVHLNTTPTEGLFGTICQ